MRNCYEGLFTVGSAGRAALRGSILQTVQHYKSCATLQGGILQAVQHYKGYESFFGDPDKAH